MGEFKDSFRIEFGKSMANLTIIFIILFLFAAILAIVIHFSEEEVAYGAEPGTLDQVIDTSAANPYIRIYFEKGSEAVARKCVEFAVNQIEHAYFGKGIPLEQIPIPIFLYSNKQDFEQCQFLDSFPTTLIVWNPKIVVYFNGSWVDLRHVLNHELDHYITLSYAVDSPCIQLLEFTDEMDSSVFFQGVSKRMRDKDCLTLIIQLNSSRVIAPIDTVFLLPSEAEIRALSRKAIEKVFGSFPSDAESHRKVKEDGTVTFEWKSK